MNIRAARDSFQEKSHSRGLVPSFSPASENLARWRARYHWKSLTIKFQVFKFQTSSFIRFTLLDSLATNRASESNSTWADVSWRLTIESIDDESSDGGIVRPFPADKYTRAERSFLNNENHRGLTGNGDQHDERES
jgi:hypothetical protein